MFQKLKLFNHKNVEFFSLSLFMFLLDALALFVDLVLALFGQCLDQCLGIVVVSCRKSLDVFSKASSIYNPKAKKIKTC